MAILCEAKSPDGIAEEIHDVSVEIILANLVRMHHLGQVQPIALIGDGPPRARHMLWDLTIHAREHNMMDPRCWGCKMRDRYSCLAEAIIE